MSYQIRRLGWLPDPLDHRDCDTREASVRARLSQVVPVLSRNVVMAATATSPVGEVRADLREWCSPIEDQGNIGSCTAHAVVGALEYFQRKTAGEYVDASRRFLYRVTRKFLGWNGDSGAFLRSTIKALRLFGVVPEEFWPYDEAKYDDEPEAFHYAFAQNFKALEYFRVPENVHDLQQVLLAGLPFVFGFTCFKSIEDKEVGETGIIPYPRRNEKSVGGHAVMAVGFTDSHIIIRNSWSSKWGDKGYGYLPWTYFDSAKPLADDCWVLVNAAWMPASEGEAFPTAFKAAAAPSRGITARPATPSVKRDAAAERLRPLIQVARGSDPIRKLPMRLSVTGPAKLDVDGGAEVALTESTSAVSLYLRQLKLLKSFDWALFGQAVDELYVLAVCWDLSGRPPRVFPPEQLKDSALRTYNLEKGEVVKFVGDGLQLWPSQKITGALNVRLVIMESDEDVRAIGKQIAAVHQAVKDSDLATALAPLLGAAGVSAPVLAAVGVAADLLTSALSSALQQNDDDLVALFDGTYGAENVSASRTDRYTQAGAEVELDFQVVPPPARAKAKSAEAPRARAAGRKRKSSS